MTVFIGADHRGYALKESLRTTLSAQGITVVDKGAHSLDPDDDYVDFAKAVADAVVSAHGAKGILVCGSGAGMCVAANKINGIRATVGVNSEQVISAMRDDDINILVLSAQFISDDQNTEMVRAFLATAFSGLDRHQRRLDKISQLEK